MTLTSSCLKQTKPSIFAWLGPNCGPQLHESGRQCSDQPTIPKNSGAGELFCSDEAFAVIGSAVSQMDAPLPVAVLFLCVSSELSQVVMQVILLFVVKILFQYFIFNCHGFFIGLSLPSHYLRHNVFCKRGCMIDLLFLMTAWTALLLVVRASSIGKCNYKYTLNNIVKWREQRVACLAFSLNIPNAVSPEV